MNFNAEFGCQKCEVRGVYDVNSHRMSFPSIDETRRTDQSFRERKQLKHHKAERSPVEELPIDMIHAFPTSDPLHLLELGVMRKCLYRWVFGETRYKGKWKKEINDKISSQLQNCNPNMPSEIHRAVRGLNTLRYWKGAEYRTILLYIGMVVFKESLSEVEYHHFLTLCCAVTICTCKFHRIHLTAAKTMFESYVRRYAQLYGSDSIGSNVHNLVHVTEDIEQLDIGSLNEISTYRYENCLRMLGLRIRNCRMPLEQVTRRLLESSVIKQNIRIDPIKFKPNVQCESKFENQTVYNKINISSDVLLSSRKVGDQWFLTKSGNIVKFRYAIRSESSLKILGNRVMNKTNFFSSPISSQILKIYVSDGELDDALSMFNLDDIMAKMIFLHFNEQHVFAPILHSLDSLNSTEQ